MITAAVLARIDAVEARIPTSDAQSFRSAGSFPGTNTSDPGSGVGELEKNSSERLRVLTSPLA
jgi:hypothetical protein